MTGDARRTAVITGSATGIGRATALRLGRRYDVVVNARTSTAEGERVVQELTDAGAKAIFVQADVSREEGAEHLIAAAHDAFGRVTVLINNAGATRAAEFGTWDERHWHDMLDTNLLSVALTTQAFAGRLGDASGSVVNISSARGLPGRARIAVAAYSAAKAGIISLTGALARALAPKVSVNVVSPGFVATRYFDRPDATPEEAATLERWRASLPIERFMEPVEIAKAVEFCVENPAMTGANLVIDGGWTVTMD